MRLEHHLVGGYVRYISPHIIIIVIIIFRHLGTLNRFAQPNNWNVVNTGSYNTVQKPRWLPKIKMAAMYTWIGLFE